MEKKGTNFLKRALLSMNKKEKRKEEYVSYRMELPSGFTVKSIQDLGRNFGSDEFRDKLLLAMFAVYVNNTQSCKDKKERAEISNRIGEDFFQFFWQSVGQPIFATVKKFQDLDQDLIDNMMNELNKLQELEAIDDGE